MTSRELLRASVGEDAFARGLGSVRPDERQAYLTAGPLSWVPVETVDRIMHAVAREAGRPAEALVVAITRSAQEKLLHTLYRILMRIVTDEALIAKTQTYYGKVYDTGQLSSVFPQPGRATVTLTGWPTIPDLQITALGAGIETTLRCAGRADASVSGRRAPGGAVYQCSWKK